MKLTSLLAGAAALIGALAGGQKASPSNQITTGSTAASASSSSVASSPSSAPVVAATKTRFGINMPVLTEWNNTRAFMNLMASGGWQNVANGWSVFPADQLDGGGNIILTGQMNAAGAMAMPLRARTGDVPIHCTYKGNGGVGILAGSSVSQSPGTVDFVYPKLAKVFFLIGYSNPADPIRSIDCREADADPKAVFDPDFLSSIKPFNTIRFLDWELTNENQGGHWAKRTTTDGMQRGTEGVAIEHMVALANAAHVNPWFALPYDADATYIENFARYVHDHLDPSLVAYVEVGNEVWNWQFGSAQESLAEGTRLQLDPDSNVARMRYYALKMTAAMTIWERVYASDRQRLVRVASGQSVWPDLLGLALDYKDTATHVDAIAFAPYFGYDLDMSDSNIDVLFGKIQTAVDNAIGTIKADRKFADHYGKRMIAYEAGHHIGGEPQVMTKLMHDPRMGDTYRRYMTAWDSNANDLMTLFNLTSPIYNYAWGLTEYSGQPASEAPKLKAALDTIAAVGSR